MSTITRIMVGGKPAVHCPKCHGIGVSGVAHAGNKPSTQVIAACSTCNWCSGTGYMLIAEKREAQSDPHH